MLGSVVDDSPPLAQHCVNVSGLLGATPLVIWRGSAGGRDDQVFVAFFPDGKHPNVV